MLKRSDRAQVERIVLKLQACPPIELAGSSMPSMEEP